MGERGGIKGGGEARQRARRAGGEAADRRNEKPPRGAEGSFLMPAMLRDSLESGILILLVSAVHGASSSVKGDSRGLSPWRVRH